MNYDQLMAEFNPEKGSALYNALAPLAAADRAYQEIIKREGEISAELATAKRGGVVLDWSTDINQLPLDKIQTDQARLGALQQLMELSQAERAKRKAAWDLAKRDADRIIADFRAEQRKIKEAEGVIAAAHVELARIEAGAHRSPQNAQSRISLAKAHQEIARTELDRLAAAYCKA
jgi:hypothetical protein